MTSAAVALAKQVGYENAGTVEFLLDTQANGGTGAFYFLEMNTRLQVEHPVTEMVVSAGGRRPGRAPAPGRRRARSCRSPRTTSRLDGHAIEARVYAEDSFGGFLPQAGTATHVRWPFGTPRSSAPRDHALASGQVGRAPSYDPMLGKVIVHGRDREAARRRLVAALDDTAVLGFTTNVGFLRVLAASDEFRDATIDTAWLDTSVEDGPAPDDGRPAPHDRRLGRRSRRRTGDQAPFRADGFRLGAAPAPTRVELDRVVVVTGASVDDGSGGPAAVSAERTWSSTSRSLDGVVQAVVNATARTRSRWWSTGSASSSSGPTSSPPTARRRGGQPHRPDAGHRARGRRRRGGCCRGGAAARRTGGDEDGAGTQGTVRRHGHDRRRGGRRAGGARVSCCSR